jgi:hypothetical protein
MRHKLTGAVFLLLSAQSFSQKKGGQMESVFKVIFLNPGIGYEQRIAGHQTIYGQAYLNFSAYFSYSDALGTAAGVSLSPAATVQYRYYYNTDKRIEQGKRTALNSANYLAPVIKVTSFRERVLASSEKKRSREIYEAGVVWGLQRNYNSRFSLDLNVGPGYFYANELKDPSGYVVRSKVSSWTIITQLNLGLWLNKRH